jgi:probable HAF family extracellular repeat protein
VLSAGTDSGANAISQNGKVAAANILSGAYRALIYGGAWTNLGTLGGTASYAAGVNNQSLVVGHSLAADGSDRAFLWTPGGTSGVSSNPQMRDLGTLGGVTSEAYSINNSGQITGYADTTKNQHAFRYAGNQMIDIGTLLKNSLPNSFGYGINDSGHIAGTAYDSGYNTASGFLYNGSSVVYLPDSGGQGVYALSINNSDQVAGYALNAAGTSHAFRYNGTMIDLGTLGGDSYGDAINNSNVVVGGSFLDSRDTVFHAFIATGNTMQDLNTQMDASGANWTLTEARAINDAGLIVGTGYYVNVLHVFLLTPSISISQQPGNQSVACQGTATFSVTSTQSPLTYQWYKGDPPTGSPLPNATNKTLTLANVTGQQAGDYYVVLTSGTVSTTSATATLTVTDTLPPVPTGCPANMTQTTASGGIPVTWTMPSANDSCDGPVPVVCTPPSGSVFSTGVTPVTCKASDSSGNASTCSFTVTVTILNAQGPSISGVQIHGPDVTVSFNAQSGAHYSLQETDNLEAGAWNDVITNIIGSGSPITVTNSGGALSSSRFYRIKVVSQ